MPIVIADRQGVLYAACICGEEQEGENAKKEKYLRKGKKGAGINAHKCDDCFA